MSEANVPQPLTTIVWSVLMATTDSLQQPRLHHAELHVHQGISQTQQRHLVWAVTWIVMIVMVPQLMTVYRVRTGMRQLLMVYVLVRNITIR